MRELRSALRKTRILFAPLLVVYLAVPSVRTTAILAHTLSHLLAGQNPFHTHVPFRHGARQYASAWDAMRSGVDHEHGRLLTVLLTTVERDPDPASPGAPDPLTGSRSRVPPFDHLLPGKVSIVPSLVALGARAANDAPPLAALFPEPPQPPPRTTTPLFA
jgi:hypothetical protein